MRRTTIALSAVVLTATLGACANQGQSTQPESGEQPAADSSKPFADIASLISGASSSMSEKKTVTLKMDMSGGGIAGAMGGMECQVDIAKTSMACTGPMEMVTTPDAMYTKMPGMGDPSKPWMKMTIDPNTPSGQAMAKSTQAMSKMTDFKEMLPPGSNIVSSTEEQVDGKDATRYEVVTDLNKAATEADPAMKQGFDTLLKSGVTELKQTIWVDSEQLPLKATSTIPPMNMMGQQVPETKTTVTYKDWGKPVTITVPSPDQVKEMPKIPGMGG